MMTDSPDENAIIEAAEGIAKPYESLSLKPYLCPAGKPTIGYGTTWYPSGKAVTMDDPWISKEQASAYMRYAMLVMWHRLRKLLTRIPTANQGAAMLDLAYNIGIGIRDGKKGDFADSDLLAAFNRGDDTRAAAEFLLWDKAHVHGKLIVLEGLKRRRQAERALYLGDV